MPATNLITSSAEVVKIEEVKDTVPEKEEKKVEEVKEKESDKLKAKADSSLESTEEKKENGHGVRDAFNQPNLAASYCLYCNQALPSSALSVAANEQYSKQYLFIGSDLAVIMDLKNNESDVKLYEEERTVTMHEDLAIVEDLKNDSNGKLYEEERTTTMHEAKGSLQSAKKSMSGPKSVETTPSIPKEANDEHISFLTEILTDEGKKNLIRMQLQDLYDSVDQNGLHNENDLKQDVIKSLEFIDSGIEDLAFDVVVELFIISNLIEFEKLKTASVKFLKTHLSLETFFDVLYLYVKYKETQLLDFSRSFFLIHAKEILASKEWLEFLRCQVFLANTLYADILNVKF